MFFTKHKAKRSYVLIEIVCGGSGLHTRISRIALT
jgi:hypothetical protein